MLNNKKDFINTYKYIRNSNIELYRIILMFFIIAHHYVVNSGLTELFDFNNITVNMVFLQIFGMSGKTIINCFSIVTGYFMVKSECSIKKFIKLFLQIETYYIIFYMIFIISGYWTFSIKECLKTLLWFIYETDTLYVGTYVIFYLFIPFLNILINGMDKKQYMLLISLLILYFTVFSTIFKHETFDFLGWMITSYFIGGIRLYLPKKLNNVKLGIIGTILSVVLMIGSIIIVDFVGAKCGFTNWSYMMSDSNKFLAMICSVFSFIFFSNLNVKYNKMINSIGKATFGILLFHANGWPMRNFLWRTVFNNVSFYNKNILPLQAIGAVSTVFLVGLIVETLRRNTIEKCTNKIINKSKLINNLEMRLKR